MSLLFDVKLNGKDQTGVEFTSFDELLDILGPDHSLGSDGVLSSKDGSIVVRAQSDRAQSMTQSYRNQVTSAGKDPASSIALEMAEVSSAYRNQTDGIDRMRQQKAPEPVETRSSNAYLVHTLNQDLFNSIVKDFRPFSRKTFEPLSHPRFGTILDPRENLLVVVDHDKVTNAFSEASRIMQDDKAHQPAVTLSFTNGVTISGSSHWVMNKYREFEDKLEIQRIEGDPEVSRNRGSAPTMEDMPADFFNNLAPKKALNPNTGRPITLYVVTEKSLEGLNFRDAEGQAVARLNEQSPSVGLRAGDVIDLSGQMSQTLTIEESDLIPARRHQSSDHSLSM